MKPKLNINEDFICRIWEGGDAYYSSLVTDSNEDVEIIDHGKRNYDAGPDYRDAKVKIGGKIYTGDIEVHRDFKNWAEHSHPKDRRYNSVILHVVMWDSEERTPPKLRIKRDLPSVVLANHLTSSIHEIWQDIISMPSDKFRLPCFEYNHLAEEPVITDWLQKLAVDRLKLRAERIHNRLQELSGSKDVISKSKAVWEQVLYEFVFEALGFSKNKEQMLKLAGNLQLKLFAKHSSGNVTGIQAMLYGGGGLLFDVRVKDGFIDEIKSFWRELEPKLRIPVMERSSWNFFRQRPQNFPTLRLAYGSQIIHKLLKDELFKKIIDIFSSPAFSVKSAVKKLESLFEPGYDEYWQSHYDLGKRSKGKNILGGKQRISDIIINVILPFVSVYSQTFDRQAIKENAVEFYNEFRIRPDNNITRVIAAQLLKTKKIKLNTPAMEQGVIQLYNFYCTRENCGKCDIGKHVFEKKGYDYKIIYY
ncbi:MAG TPA: DUF2851 family protein [Ignavibacteria bacterium]|nr:DUF2851 family protein [Ignavibacteria bacterium]